VKAFLLHSHEDFELERRLPPNEKALVQDLGLDVVFETMAAGDEFLLGVARTVVLSSLHEPAEITYRQRILADCIAQPALVRQIYDLAVAAIDGERRIWRSVGTRNPDFVLSTSLQALQLFVPLLKQLRRIADEQAPLFRSEGFTRFFETVRAELDDAYLHTLDEHLRLLSFRRGVPVGARLGKRNSGDGFVLRRPHLPRWSWRRLFPIRERSAYTIVLPPRDDAGAQALTDLRHRGINLVANALSQSTDHIQSFFTMVRFELGFYLGCVNLRDRLLAKREPVCFPVPRPRGNAVLTCTGMYDVGLSLRMHERVVGNDIGAEGRSLVVITGANQGGKSTFLRSVGVAQLMLQAGMFVGAERFEGDVRDSVFTHFKRREDVTMTSGKLDEELKRMSEIADRLTPNALALFNESFSATNEREGADIAEEIIQALLEAGAKVLFVTHSFELAQRYWRRRLRSALFLRAERRADGERTFRQIEGDPLSTSYGQDLFRQIFAPQTGGPTARPTFASGEGEAR